MNADSQEYLNNNPAVVTQSAATVSDPFSISQNCDDKDEMVMVSRAELNSVFDSIKEIKSHLGTMNSRLENITGST